jgi:hypothetical protein
MVRAPLAVYCVFNYGLVPKNFYKVFQISYDLNFTVHMHGALNIDKK